MEIAYRPSRTAEWMAFFRALESARPAALFVDPYARAFLSPSLRAVAQLACVPRLGGLVRRVLETGWPGACASGIARTRYIDDQVRAAVAGGIGQVVLLGAGFDARAYRLDALDGLSVYEVDRAETQARKRARLPSVPVGVRFVAADLSRVPLGDALTAAGFENDQPTLFLWEGVTNYLDAGSVDATLRFVAHCAPGTRLVFTFVHRDAIDNLAAFEGTERLRSALRRAREPWTFGLDPAELDGYLATRGLRLDEEVAVSALRARYLGVAGRGYGFYRVAVATVADA